MLNRVILIGRLTAKPELRYTESNLPYARFTVAVNRNFRNNDGQAETDFINVIVWRKQAENVCNFLDKGSLVMIEGSLSVNNYEDSEGNRRTFTEVTAQNVQFLDRKNNSSESEEEQVSLDDYNDVTTLDDDFLD